MQDEHISKSNQFLGIMNFDDDLHRIKNTDFLYALNVNNSLNDNAGAVTPILGSLKINFPLPAGENTCIGTYEDKRCNTVIYFVHNSLGQHLILRYYPAKDSFSAPYGVIEKIVQSPTLNFNKDWKITEIELIDNKFLYWTDAYSEKDFIEGNPPRKINIEKANVTNRELCFELHLRDAETFLNNAVAEGLSLLYRAEAGTNSIQITQAPGVVQAFIGQPKLFLEFTEAQINSFFSAWATAELCDDCKLIIKTIPQNGISSIFKIEQNYSGPPPPPVTAKAELLIVPIDHYPISYSGNDVIYSLEDQHIDLIKYPPICEPIVCYDVDPDTKSNNVNKQLFQFRLRYWYDDGEKSAWGPISTIPLFADLSGNILDSLNFIDVDYTADRLNTIGTRAILRYVEIAVRDANDGVFRSVDKIPACKFSIDSNKYNFYNDRLYNTVASDDNTLDPQVQVLKLYDQVPLLSGGLEAIADREGNNRLFLGANLENYDAQDCVDLSYEVLDSKPEDDACLVTIKGTVAAYDYEFPTSPPFDNRNPTFVPSTRPVSYRNKPLDGVVVYAAGTPYFTISDGIKNDGSATGAFELKLPKAKTYVLRIASIKCGFNNDNGAIHNLNNGLVWQKTSGPIIDFANAQAAQGRRWERTIISSLIPNNGSVLDLDANPNFGEVKILNYHFDNYRFDPMGGIGPNDYDVQEVYFLDNVGEEDSDPNDYDVRKGAIGVEMQLFGGFRAFLQDGGIGFLAADGNRYQFLWYEGCITDHNGHAIVITTWQDNSLFLEGVGAANIFVADPCDSYPFSPGPGPPVPPGNMRELVSKAVGSTPAANKGNAGTPDNTLSFFVGGLEDLENENLAPGYPLIPVLPLPPNVINRAAQDLIVFNIEQEFAEKSKTAIQGRVVSQLGFGVEGVSIIYENCGRQENTDVDGGYSIAVYCPFDNPDGTFGRKTDRILPVYIADVCSEFLPNPVLRVPDVSLYCSLPYDFETFVDVEDFVMPFSLSLIQKDKYLKRGGVYDWGIVYVDYAGRMSTVSKANAKLINPYHTENGEYGRNYILWSVDNQPPAWATHYRLVRTRESLYRRYLYWIPEEVQYVKIDEISEVPINTDFSNADATHILIDITPTVPSDFQDNPVDFFFSDTNSLGFEPTIQDRVRLVIDENGDLVSTTDIIDYEIVGIYTNNNRFYVAIKQPELFREIKSGWLMEFYSPKKSEESVFFEIGECHEIIDAGTANRRHAGPRQNQVIGVQPAQGLLVGGDTYWRKRDFPVQTAINFDNLVETPNFTDRFDSIAEDIGRVNVDDDTFGQRFYYNIIRFSQIFIPNSKINGLSSFRASDYIGLNLDYGNIMKLVSIDNVMLAICQFKTQPIYIAKNRILDLSGGGSIGRSDKIMNVADELKYDYGTQNPESVVEQNGHVFAWDVYRGVVWRYSSNGQYPISDYKAHTLFESISNIQLPLDRKNTRVYGGYEPLLDSYILTINNFFGIFSLGFTIAFSEQKNGFNTYYSYEPEYYGRVGTKMVMFKDGELWLHAVEGQPYNNFFGIQYTSKLRFVHNIAPRAVKLFWNLQLLADKLWFAPFIEIPSTHLTPDGMQSQLLESHFTNEEGIWKADFLRDQNDPSAEFAAITPPALKETTALLRGRELRGEVIIVELELLNSNEFAILRESNIETNLSMDTKIE